MEKVKVALEQVIKAQRGSTGIALLFKLGARWGWMVNATPRRLYTRKEAHYLLCRRLGGPHSRYGRVRKISPPPAFDPRTVQPVPSRYTDYAIPAQKDRKK